MNKYKRSCLIVGKMPPPVNGVTTWTRIVKNSEYWMSHCVDVYDININKSIAQIGTFGFAKIIMNLRHILCFLRLMAKREIDSVIVPLSQTKLVLLRDLILVAIASKYGSRVYVYLHGSALRISVFDNSWLLLMIAKHVIPKVDGCIVLSESLKKVFYGIVPRNKIYVISNGVDLKSRERDAVRNQVLFLGNIIAEKGVPEFMEAARIVARRRDITFILAGEIGDSELAKKVEMYADCVKYVGPSYGDEKYELMIGSDILVFTPTGPEGQPYVIIEAMAMSMAIISTRQGAIPETLDNGMCGVLLEEARPKNIADAIERLYDDNNLMITYQARARVQYENYFTERHMINKLESILGSEQ